MRWPAWANWMRREQNSGRGIRREETVGKESRGVEVLVGDGVMEPIGTWWRTVGPARGGSEGACGGTGGWLTFGVVEDGEENCSDHCCRKLAASRAMFDKVDHILCMVLEKRMGLLAPGRDDLVRARAPLKPSISKVVS